ncbi:ABC transporter ATP-binding protein [Microbacterium sp. BWT-B31]|uniref:ABC transporter ATP-binding protein n=1 Tax=Microbacterium sp. BWT-B31 TaxID=3232072 RepID=UPI0035270F22
MTEPLMQIHELSVDYHSRSGNTRALDQVSLTVNKNEILGLVGESGCGKSTLAMSILRMIEAPNRISGGSIHFDGVGDVLKLRPKELAAFRWEQTAIAFQGAQSTLNPVLNIADQVALVLESHGQKSDRTAVRRRLGDLCDLVGLDPDRVLRAFPHELSGGMKQRVVLMLGLLLSPKLLILDEPTTALDVISQALIIDNLRKIQSELAISMVFVTHDMSVVAELADRVAVMYAGTVAETGTVGDVFRAPAHPYTRALMSAIPSIDREPADLRSIPGRPPDLRELPGGCRFMPRCAMARPDCAVAEPPLLPYREHGQVACFVASELPLAEHNRSER